MTEINWTSLLHKLQADLESGDWLTKSYQIAGRRTRLPVVVVKSVTSASLYNC